MCTPESDYETAMTDCEKPAVASRQDEFSSRQDLERALQKSRESEARLRKIVDTIPTLAWCNLPDGSNEFVNQRWSDYTGLSPEEAQRRGCKAVIHPEDLRGSPDYRRHTQTIV